MFIEGANASNITVQGIRYYSFEPSCRVDNKIETYDDKLRIQGGSWFERIGQNDQVGYYEIIKLDENGTVLSYRFNIFKDQSLEEFQTQDAKGLTGWQLTNRGIAASVRRELVDPGRNVYAPILYFQRLQDIAQAS